MEVRRTNPDEESYEFPYTLTEKVDGVDTQVEYRGPRYTVAQLQDIIDKAQAKLDAITAFEASR